MSTKPRTESPESSVPDVQVPFFRPSLTDDELNEVVACLRSGWLTTGPRTKQFEEQFAESVGAKHAVAVNSCTAALHLSVEALELRAGQGVLVPTMTFAATAEVVRYQGAIPILVDCDPVTLNIDLNDAGRKIEQLRAGQLPEEFDPQLPLVGIIPVHVGGLMFDLEAMQSFATEHKLWCIEDAAHALPAAWRSNEHAAWRQCGEGTADTSCYSFYANKTITTGEGGMVVTNNDELATRMRVMSLHGLSQDAWKRFMGGGSWDYQIIAPGFKYNLTDVAASLGIHQLRRAEDLRCQRQRLAMKFIESLKHIEEIELPPVVDHRIHSWHLFPIRLRLDKLSIDRNTFLDELKRQGVGCSVHWRPLHMHPYYRETFGWQEEHLPTATATWQRLVSLPLFPDMSEVEQKHVIDTVRNLCHSYRV